MGFFSKILAKLGIGDSDDTATRASGVTVTSASRSVNAADGAATAAVPVVDVVAQLEQRAAAFPQKLNWRTSIADLLKLLDIDNSLSARKELAAELNCPQELMGGDHSKMNIWLHKTVLQRIADNGGNVPKDLLD